ncbi:MAG: tetratricopeptide repeat protein [Elusimicrobia bacterium]|nr:tetratricopeptide repeat protein [Elusimicrobiota bacterium]MBP9698697.1 tetratricopeptide repeat protein [Elusimicrobiota bacterium]
MSLRQSKSPLVLAEQFLIIQETAPVAAHREWLLRKGKNEWAHQMACLEFLYGNDTARAIQELALVKNKDPWTLERENYLTGLAHVQKSLVETKSDHFIVRTNEDQAFLAPQALSALETAYVQSAPFLGLPSRTPLLVEIYSSVEDYVTAAHTSRFDVETTGGVTCFRFGRILALSPGATAFGYRWIDRLVHEYVHGQVTRLTGANAPLWLQEGTARHLEGRGRLSGDYSLSSYDRTLLTRAALEGRVSLSSGSLSDGDWIALFPAVSCHAVEFLADEFGEDKGRDLLSAFRRVPDPFVTVLGINETEFEKRWLDSLSDLTETPTGGDRGAMGPSIFLTPAGDLELTKDPLRSLLVKGDQLLKQGAVPAAVMEYKKAVDLQPDNGVALVRLAQVYVKESKTDAARDLFIRAITHNLSYATPFVRLGELHYDEGRYEEAQTVLQEALEINPFDPKIHETLGLIAVDVGHFVLARQSLGLALKFDPTNGPLRESIENMPKPR